MAGRDVFQQEADSEGVSLNQAAKKNGSTVKTVLPFFLLSTLRAGLKDAGTRRAGLFAGERSLNASGRPGKGAGLSSGRSFALWLRFLPERKKKGIFGGIMRRNYGGKTKKKARKNNFQGLHKK